MYYITTPIPYTNDTPHLGHLLEALFNDTIARYRRRSLTETVSFSMGVDQNGLKNYQYAQKKGLPVEEFVKQETQKFIDLWRKFEISNDIWTETASPKHSVVSQIFWKKLQAKDLIYKKQYTGLYCVGCEAFYSPSQLIDGKICPIHQKEVITLTEQNYFFKLSQFGDQILEYLTSTKILPDKARTEWQNFVREGLDDISVSREKVNLPWGVEVPGDPDQIIYIWIEALANYATGLVDEESCDKYLEFPHLQAEVTTEIWSQIVAKMPIDFQYMGKDLPRFHLIYWQAILMALDLPTTKVNAIHGFINDKDGIKMSKSLGNGVLPEELVSKFGIEGTRYLMLAEINPIEDTSFDFARTTDSYNANLADNLGNLVLRVANLIEIYLGGNLDLDNLTSEDFEEIGVDLANVFVELENFNTQKALQSLFAQSTKINQYLESQKPWTLAKDMSKNNQKIIRILTTSAYCLVEIAKALSIFMPATGEQIVSVFNQDKIVKPEPLFAKII